MEAFCPAPVVVQNNVLRDGRVLLEVLGGLRGGAFTAAEAEQDLGADFANGSDDLVGRTEVVAARIVRTGVRVGEDVEHIAACRDQSAAWGIRCLEFRVDIRGTIGVVGADQVDTGHAVAGGDIDMLRHVPAAEFEVLGLVSTGCRRPINTLQRP